MGLRVNDDMSVLKGKTLKGYNFNGNNESIIYVTDKDGNEERVRISAAMRDLLLAFNNLQQ